MCLQQFLGSTEQFCFPKTAQFYRFTLDLWDHSYSPITGVAPWAKVEFGSRHQQQIRKNKIK